ncbi:unnamed protein product, partial [Iphiclides podalirius]
MSASTGEELRFRPVRITNPFSSDAVGRPRLPIGAEAPSPIKVPAHYSGYEYDIYARGFSRMASRPNEPKGPRRRAPAAKSRGGREAPLSQHLGNKPAVSDKRRLPNCRRILPRKS